VTATFFTTQDFTKLLVSEIMQPAGHRRDDGDNLEFLGLKTPEPTSSI
jgi:hypothetical protein